MKCGDVLPLVAAFSLAWIANTFGAEGILHAVIKDAITGRQAPCTVTITDADGKVVVESDSFSKGFRCSGEFSKRLPAGKRLLNSPEHRKPLLNESLSTTTFPSASVIVTVHGA